MNNLTLVCVLVVAGLCVNIKAAYVDCAIDCLFADFLKPTACECKSTRKLHWGKRAPRAHTHKLPTFRYGKRAVPYVSSDVDDRIDTLRSIQDSYLSGNQQYEYEV